MRKPLYIRILLLLLLYSVIFTGFVVIQFPKQGGFTLKIGDMVVTGSHRVQGETYHGESGLEGDVDSGAAEQGSMVYLLSGKASVGYGGIEFNLGPGLEDSSFLLLDSEGVPVEMLPDSLTVSEYSASFSFPGAAEIIFTANNYANRSQELRIYCSFYGDYTGIELPFKLLSKARLSDSGNRQLVVTSGGLDYSFDNAKMDMARSLLVIDAKQPILSYRASIEIPEKTYTLEDYILPAAISSQSYSETLKRWIDQNFALWSRMIREQHSEDIIVALAAESIERNVYRTAVSSVTSAFLNGDARTYQSTVYLGRLDIGNRTLASADQAKTSRLSRLINEKSPDFLLEENIVEYLAVRGNTNLLNNAADVIRSLDSNNLNPVLFPGILEGCTEWNIHRQASSNPFSRLIEPSLDAITGMVFPFNGESKIFVFTEEKNSENEVVRMVDIEYNLKLGKSLLNWAEANGEETWTAIARSLILSALAQGEETGRNNFYAEENHELREHPSSARINTAHFYRILKPSIYHPRAVTVRESASRTWAWTAASAISSATRDNIFEIAVSFPAGETHYIIIRGVPSFSKIQLYGMDYPTDPQFERYDSMGWAYNASNQTLLVKMKHREPVELIRIYYQE